MLVLKPFTIALLFVEDWRLFPLTNLPLSYGFSLLIACVVLWDMISILYLVMYFSSGAERKSLGSFIGNGCFCMLYNC